MVQLLKRNKRLTKQAASFEHPYVDMHFEYYAAGVVNPKWEAVTAALVGASDIDGAAHALKTTITSNTGTYNSGGVLFYFGVFPRCTYNMKLKLYIPSGQPWTAGKSPYVEVHYRTATLFYKPTPLTTEDTWNQYDFSFNVAGSDLLRLYVAATQTDPNTGGYWYIDDVQIIATQEWL